MTDTPIAQTFRINTSDEGVAGNSSGAYLTKIDLYFQSKDSTIPVAVEIREVDPASGFLKKTVVPFGSKIVQAADINTSTDSSAPTPIIFDTPVYLLNNTDYAFTVRPLAANPNYTLWVSRLGEDDLVTGNRITSQPYSGVVFVSSNDQTYTAVQEEDIKFRLYVANFATNQTGIVSMKNIDREYFTVANTDGSFNIVGEQIDGETTLVFGSAISANVGESVLGGTSGANGVVTFNSGSTIRLKEVTTAAKFTNGETASVRFANGSTTGTTGTIDSQSTPTGKAFFYDSSTQANTFLFLSNPSGSFVANTFIRGQINGYDGRIVSIDNLPIDTLYTHASRLALQGTTVSVKGKLATSSSALDSQYRNINENNDTVYNSRRFVLSKTNETNNLSGNKSSELQFTLTNGVNKRHSPAIDNDRTALYTIENLINNDSTNEDQTSGGNAKARYITRTVTLADGQDAEDLRIFISAYKPSTADIKMYYKILHREDGDTLDDRDWVEMTQVTSTSTVSDSENTEDVREFEYKIPTDKLTGSGGEVQYTNSQSVTYTGFKYFAIKAVLLSSTPSRVPRMRDFRVIALQI